MQLPCPVFLYFIYFPVRLGFEAHGEFFRVQFDLWRFVEGSVAALLLPQRGVEAPREY